MSIVEDTGDSGEGAIATKIPYAYLFHDSSIGTVDTVLTQNVPAELDMNGQLDVSNMMTNPSGGIIRYTGSRSFVACIDMNLSGRAVSSSSNYEYQIRINAIAPDAGNVIFERMSTANTENVGIQRIVQLNANDEVSIFIEVTSSSSNARTIGAQIKIKFGGWVS